MNHGQLLGHCVRVLDTYDKEMTSLEEQINAYLKQHQVTEEGDRTFIMEVFSGCVRYSIVMKIVTEGFYAKDGKSTLRSDQSLYSVICYLILFRMDELGLPHLRKFVQSQNASKMYKFLNFFLDERNLLTWVKDQWGKFYEQSFVETNLLSPLERWLSELQEMVTLMKDKLDHKVKPKKKVVPATEVKPFKLTQPKARSVPVPEPIPKLQKHTPPPSGLYRTPSEFDRINRQKEVNRRAAEERLMEASRIQFACANPEKSQKAKEVLNNIMSEEDGKLDFDKHKAHPVPGFLSKEVPVKLNAASILREGMLYQRKEEEELKKLEKLEAGARDSSAFIRWQSDMRQRDLEVQLAEIERRRLEGKLSHEEAILARQNLIRDNKNKVQDMKKETEELMKEFLEKKFREEQMMKQLVEDTMQGHRNAKDAKKKLQEYKQKIVQEVTEESRELMQKALEKAEIEMRRKMELIHQIRAMEAVPAVRQKFVDLTSTAGMGLLSEMSIAELQERLSLMKTSQKEEEEQRRDDILASKQAKDQLLLDTLETISKHRTEQTRAAALKYEERKKTRGVKVEIQDEKLTELQRRLEEKKSERLREQENAKLVASRHSAQRTRSLIHQKNYLEQNRWQELEQSREKTARVLSQGVASSKSASRLRGANAIAMTT
ncbi:cilia- and flagella-associated protein 99-like [Haliotis rubra]|uniref:cilia- and flagella-associated protein 99-like n=1 Tax=Haliotis rubra TaxID=36100 RepID=UPI001EE51E53|nr:cilia- and flagella-associated protein 99-like [Haliotis rubra]XP_046574849.1 cilia- and flagella-associated protein 99-like [Haliotis rubra]